MALALSAKSRTSRSLRSADSLSLSDAAPPPALLPCSSSFPPELSSSTSPLAFPPSLASLPFFTTLPTASVRHLLTVPTMSPSLTYSREQSRSSHCTVSSCSPSPPSPTTVLRTGSGCVRSTPNRTRGPVPFACGWAVAIVRPPGDDAEETTEVADAARAPERELRMADQWKRHVNAPRTESRLLREGGSCGDRPMSEPLVVERLENGQPLGWGGGRDGAQDALDDGVEIGGEQVGERVGAQHAG